MLNHRARRPWVLLVLFNLTVSLLAIAAHAGPATTPAAKAAPQEPPRSWSDPRVLDELTRSCAFDPDQLPEGKAQAWLGDRGPGDSSPLSCTAELDQSCEFDPCFDEQEACKPGCTKACGACGSTCVKGCESCKSACKDLACRKSCATKCASCREACVRQRDRCATGTCTEVYKQCRLKLRATWEKNGCARACKPYVACQTRCSESKKDQDCMKLCKKHEVKACDMRLCQGGPMSMGIDPAAEP